LLAARLSGSARVRLLAPPPLDRSLDVVTTGEGVELRDADQVIAKAWPAPLDLQLPQPPTLVQSRAAASHYPGLHEHAFPSWFGCGPRRAPGDGLRVFPGPTEVTGQVACTWTPDAGLATASGSIDPVFIWAALDCPSGWAHIHATGAPAVLGEFAVRIDSPVTPGEELVLCGWQTGAEGRKLFSASALFSPAGALLACANATWIRLH
jgi:hypothetical protein